MYDVADIDEHVEVSHVFHAGRKHTDAFQQVLVRALCARGRETPDRLDLLDCAPTAWSSTKSLLARV